MKIYKEDEIIFGGGDMFFGINNFPLLQIPLKKKMGGGGGGGTPKNDKKLD
jgi:hypothetical protein